MFRRNLILVLALTLVLATAAPAQAGPARQQSPFDALWTWFTQFIPHFGTTPPQKNDPGPGMDPDGQDVGSSVDPGGLLSAPERGPGSDPNGQDIGSSVDPDGQP
jgi:hypothetical protein